MLLIGGWREEFEVGRAREVETRARVNTREREMRYAPSGLIGKPLANVMYTPR